MPSPRGENTDFVGGVVGQVLGLAHQHARRLPRIYWRRNRPHLPVRRTAHEPHLRQAGPNGVSRRAIRNCPRSADDGYSDSKPPCSFERQVPTSALLAISLHRCSSTPITMSHSISDSSATNPRIFKY